MTDPAAPTTPEPFNFVRDTDGVLVQDDRHKIGHWLPAWAYHALRGKWQSEAEAGSRLGSTTPAEAECNHPPSMLTTSTYNGPDGRMAGVEQRCECGASWRYVTGSTPAAALDVERLGDAMVNAFRTLALRHWPHMKGDGWPAYDDGKHTPQVMLVSELEREVAAEYARLAQQDGTGE